MYCRCTVHFLLFRLGVTRRAGPDHTSNARRASAPLLMVRVRLPSEPLGTALHNLSRDSGDFFTTLSILLYLLDYPTPRSDYYRMYTSRVGRCYPGRQRVVGLG